ncbi:HTH_Tnp_Tc3_2 domain-containing protein [Trichonephila clavipes]|nr:HTH_Tnp_Tc3_2 domain-containing protein [Trichonephila clavipes]
MEGGQKARDREICKGKLALILRGKRRLKRIARSQRCQSLAQITTQLNDVAIRTVSKWTVQTSGNRQPKRVPLLHARHREARLACAREHRYWSVEDWK